ncbi:E3 ubiquitin-protein ligase TRIM47-like [Thalassophryne amazonica]|uniref:E3 ubiquitin-protein ligase TRIM47-like n=1 Tax=Thalassophryne amazonica TaxID=390379 RepID=UPI0014714044|nr:E3 ubiquitin-protein ligase TRIM47-like [Thalassophryne amazonica]
MSELADECCICLEEFSSPVTLPCAHCFCLSCIGEYWSLHGVCQCPLCKAIFPTRPQLKTYQMPDHGATAEESNVTLRAGEVPCDVCPTKHPAIKSCLVCLASYCDLHLEPHYKDAALWRHHLISVVKNLEDSVCRLHGKQLDRFCRSDQTCICGLCAYTDHRGHHIITTAKEAAKKKVLLKRRRLKLHQVIQEAQASVEEINLSTDIMRENQKEAWTRCKELKEMEEEISQLQSTNSELDELLHIEDDLQFLQMCCKSATMKNKLKLKRLITLNVKLIT